MDEPLPADTLEAAQDRIERIMRGEDIAKKVYIGSEIPAYYGTKATADDVVTLWLLMWRGMEAADRLRPGDEVFYQSNAIGWASR